MDMLASVSYSDIVATIAMIVAIIAVPVSGYLSYHFAIRGEKRKEFNAVAEPVMMSLLEQLDCVNEGHYCGDEIKTNEIRKLLHVSDKKLRSQILIDYKAYEKAMTNSGSVDEWSKFTYSSEESRIALRSAIQQLAKNVERR
ncbi:hypothetical protein [Serratia silvae]|uniref:DUF4760 domain-containing protein n=1 Tax=Serratia silvae TaxID=2824122 RepID=A0ABT0K9R6_9GAMM|nr:hypothetical protein [Serratia silvae]MCL1028507.1 hypothetical protein [Serratia silvae]